MEPADQARFRFSALRGPWGNPEETAPVGQTDRHFPQRMHSGPLMSPVT